jgi:hypothetical protein
MKPKVRRRLKNLRVDEVSFVDRPANLRPFLFWKRLEPVPDGQISKAADIKLSVSFESDGTADGTKVEVNGEELADLTDLNLSYWPLAAKALDVQAAGGPTPSFPPIAVSCSYAIAGKPDRAGFKQTQRFELRKNLVEVKDSEDWVQKPYPNEHASRQNEPDKYKRVRRQNDKFGPGIHAIFGVTDDGNAEIQAIRFDAKKFTPAEAKKWLEDHKYKTALEEATGVKKASPDHLASLRKAADVPDDVDGDLAEELAGPAETVALYKADLPQELAGAIESILKLACHTEVEGASEVVETGVSKDTENKDQQIVTDPAKAGGADKAAETKPSPAGISEEDVGRIANKVVELLAKQKPAEGSGSKDKADDVSPADGGEEDVSPEDLGRELAQATVDALNGDGKE